MADQLPPPRTEHIRRLSIIAQLYRRGVENSHQSEPTSSFSVLAFHDAVEMMLSLAAERVQATMKRNPDFGDYWNAMSLAGHPIPDQIGLARLNAIRVNFKHKGILPHKIEVEGFRALVTNFMDDVSTSIFDVSIHSVGRANLIRDSVIRNQVLESEKALSEGNMQVALQGAAEAFAKAVHLGMRQDHYQWSLAERFRSISFFSFGHDSLENGAKRAVQEIGNVFSETMSIVSYNISLDEYQLFKTYTPVVHVYNNDNSMVQWMREATQDERVARRCVDFAIDYVLKTEETLDSFPESSNTKESASRPR